MAARAEQPAERQRLEHRPKPWIKGSRRSSCRVALTIAVASSSRVSGSPPSTSGTAAMMSAICSAVTPW
nr:hypothetical protein [Phytohabitans houttuyneae]